MNQEATINRISLITRTSGTIEIYLKTAAVGQEVPVSDFTAAKKEYFNKVCLGLGCQALMSRECFGPKLDVRVVEDQRTVMLAQAEINTNAPITEEYVDLLKCDPEPTGII